MSRKIDDDAGETFDVWFHHTMKHGDNLSTFTDSEKMELAWREAARLYSTRSLVLQRPFVDPNLRKLASVVAFEPEPAA